MVIRLANNCSNCGNISEGSVCGIHDVKVNQNYTCDAFTMKASCKMTATASLVSGIKQTVAPTHRKPPQACFALNGRPKMQPELLLEIRW